MSYGKFATIYDELMKEAPYDDWVHFVTKVLKDMQMNPTSFIDLGCGTGEISIRLANKGYEVTGVDLSTDMLAIAEQKANHGKQKLQFVQQDLLQLDSASKYDIAICFCDVLNYITDENDINKVFSNVNRTLKQDGIFLFDVHSISYMDYLLSSQTIAHVTDDISYIWFCSNGNNGELYYDLTFFVKDEQGNFQRFDEEHIQKTFPISDYTKWLEQNGFEITNILGDFELEKIDEHDVDRIFFVCRKTK